MFLGLPSVSQACCRGPVVFYLGFVDFYKARKGSDRAPIGSLQEPVRAVLESYWSHLGSDWAYLCIILGSRVCRGVLLGSSWVHGDIPDDDDDE